MATERTIGKTTFSFPDDESVTISRTFDAPAQLVFDAWTKPEHIAKWFGSRGSTMPVCEIDLRAGGKWRFVIREANGNEMGMSGEYKEITPPGRVVYTEGFDDYADIGPALVTMTMEERDGKTLVVSTSKYTSKETRDAIIEYGMEEGANETYDRLEELLAALS